MKGRAVRRRPERELEVLLTEQSIKKHPQHHNKQFTAVKAADGEGLSVSVLEPDAEQLAKINQFTQSEKTADELIAFRTYSCNDMIDRDDDRFRTAAVEDFATIPQPYSPVGKSFMVSHEHTKLPKGRIFDVGTEKVGSNLFLTNDVYIPKTVQNQEFIENIDFGVYWAVSVGVLFNEALCVVGKEHDWGWAPWWCSMGHEKGLYYDPESDEVDDWGWPDPVAPDSKNAVKTICELEGAADFYELSMVYLGAQYFAELAQKDPSFRGIVKAASKSIPVIGLGREESKALPLPQVPAQVAEARERYRTIDMPDGGIKWTDDQDMVWVYKPETDKVLSLGKAAEDNEEEDNNAEDGTDPDLSGSDEVEDEDGDEGGGEPDANPDAEEDEVGDGSGSGEGLSGSDEEEGLNDDDDDEEDKSAPPLVVAARKAGLPDDLVGAARKGPRTFAKAVAEFASKNFAKVALADEIIEYEKGQAVHWFTVANQSGPNVPVDVSGFQKIIDMCGDDLSALKTLTESQLNAARIKFPQAVKLRRSTTEVAPIEREDKSADDDGVDPETARVSRLH